MKFNFLFRFSIFLLLTSYLTAQNVYFEQLPQTEAAIDQLTNAVSRKKIIDFLSQAKFAEDSRVGLLAAIYSKLSN